MAENHPEQTRAPRFRELLLAMKKAKEEAIANNVASVSCDQLETFDKQYDEIIKTAYAENPLPETTEKKRGRKKKGIIQHLDCDLVSQSPSIYFTIKIIKLQ